MTKAQEYKTQFRDIIKSFNFVKIADSNTFNSNILALWFVSYF